MWGYTTQQCGRLLQRHPQLAPGSGQQPGEVIERLTADPLGQLHFIEWTEMLRQFWLEDWRAESCVCGGNELAACSNCLNCSTDCARTGESQKLGDPFAIMFDFVLSCSVNDFNDFWKQLKDFNQSKYFAGRGNSFSFHCEVCVVHSGPLHPALFPCSQWQEVWQCGGTTLLIHQVFKF